MMNRKPITMIGSLAIVLVVGALVLPPLVQGLAFNSPDDSQKITDTIHRSIRINLAAVYTLDSSEFTTVFINDPRGGEMPPEALAVVRESRQDFTLSKDQVGYLDYMQAVIDQRKKTYDNFISFLHEKQEAGTISAEEQAILDGETNGWPTRIPEITNATTPTPLCIQHAESTSPVVYPAPDLLLPSTAVPEIDSTMQPCGPTPVPTPFMIEPRAEGRGPNPETLPQESFEIDILSIKIEGDVARATVYKSGVTSEEVLVKVNDQWYIAGGKLLEYAP